MMRVEGPKHLFLLGSVRIKDGETVVDQFRSHRAVALLVYLASQEHPVPRSELVELIWPDMPLERGQANLRWALSYCKKLLPDCWEVSRQAAQFLPHTTCRVDLLALQEALANDDVTLLETAVSQVQGEFCRGFYFDESPEFETWLLTQREYWRQQTSAAWQRLINHYRSHREYERALAFARELLNLDTWQENAHRQVMELLARSGDFNGAIAQYESCRRLLAEKLHVEPMPGTEQLHRRILSVRSRPRHNLPAHPTPFIGRERELSELAALLAAPENRLVTIVAPGGMGKTRLAQAAAAQQVSSFFEGVAYTPLASVESPALLPTTIVEGLSSAGLIAPHQGHKSAVNHLLDELAEKEMLLVLDNYDQLLPDISLLAIILERALGIKLLVTSRERLSMRWERPYALHGLPFPSLPEDPDWQQYSAPGLFLQTARQVNPGFQPAQGDRAAIMRICELVEGMPLALELAATWVRVQTPAVIAVEISSSLAVLRTQQKDLPARQRSMHAVFDQTWTRLPPEEQAVLAKLSVFRGPFTYEAAHVVAGADWPLLAALGDKSLLRQYQQESESETAVFFELHELLRQYAAERLAAQNGNVATRQRHCQYYAALLAKYEPRLSDGYTEKAALQKMRQEIDNIRTAWDWALSATEGESLNQMIESMHLFYALPALVRDGQAVMAAAAEQLDAVQKESGELSRAYGRILARLGDFTWLLHENYLAAEQQLHQSLAILETQPAPLEVAKVLHTLGNTVYTRDLAAGRQYWRRSLEIYREIGNVERQATILRNLCVTSPTYAEMLTYWEQAIAMAQASNDRRNEGHLYFIRGDCECHVGHMETGQKMAQKSVEMMRALDDPPHLILALNVLADMHITQHDFAKAQPLLQEMQEIAERMAIKWHSLLVQVAFARFALEKKELVEAEALLSAVLGDAPEEGSYQSLRLLVLYYQGRAHFLRGELAAAREKWEQFWAAGRNVDFKTDSRRWRAKLGVGETWLRAGDWETAVSHLADAGQLAASIGAATAWEQALKRLEKEYNPPGSST